MQTSQTLKDLANSAKRNQDEFNNTLIEIHKQSALQIEQDLNDLYKNAMNIMQSDMQQTLTQILLETTNTKSEIINQVTPSLSARIFNGIVLSVAMIFLVLGFLANFWLNHNEIEYYQEENKRLREQNQELSQWQIPINYRHTQQNSMTHKIERYLLIPPKILTQEKDGSQWIKLNKGAI